MKSRVNLCVYNHLARGVSDQIWFASETFRQHGYELCCSQTLRPDCMNFVIENFVEEDANRLKAFCRRFNKQIGVFMTEHVAMEDGQITFNGKPLQDTEYIGNKEQRLYSLLSLDNLVFAFFTMGELPELFTLPDILPTRHVYRIPYPSIANSVRPPARREYDLVFTGARTPHRESVLKRLAESYRLVQTRAELTERQRAQVYASAKVALNVPQSADWKWVSPMRVLFGLRSGTPTVHLGLRDETQFCQTVLEPVELDRAVREYESLFDRQLDLYEDLVRSKHNCRMPSGLLDLWSELESVG